MIDYKISRQTKVDDTFRLKVVFYEGAITTKKELDADGEIADVTRYRRTKKLGEKWFKCHEKEFDSVLNALNQKLEERTTKNREQVIDKQKYAEDIRPTVLREIRTEKTERKPVV